MVYRILILICFCLAGFAGYGQVVTQCPQNIGFENGTLENWECSTGNISQTGSMAPNAVRPAFLSLISSGPIPNQHTVIQRGSSKDYYGNFSTDAPNGSDYVVQLGNDSPGRGAERISYTVNVPANVDNYSIIFNYAVVFESPTHSFDEQPKFTARVFDVANNTSTDCGSFEFVASGGLPGFLPSPNSSRNPSGGGGGGGAARPVPVLYKNWSPVLVNLDAYLGRTIRLEFTTNDCSLGGHFGYAYIDFDENCSIPVTGNITCPGNESITLKTLPGFFGYRWFNAETSELLGTGDSVVVSPVPPIGTRIAIELIPYPGLGCTQTLYTTIGGMYMNIIDPPPNCISVDITDISLKAGNSSDLTYTYWMDPQATRRLDDPKHVYISGTYYIKGRSSSGCFLIRPVVATISLVPPLVLTRVLQAVNPATVDITTAFSRNEGISYSFWLNPAATIPIPDPTRIGRRGTYHIKSVTPGGCISITPILVDIIIPDVITPNTFSPNNDGVNDEFTVLLNSNVEVNYFKIFNRWGDVVYTTTNIDRYWSGFKETTEVPVGVYYWVIDGILENKKYIRSGYVTLVR
ncbi:gliding motility-associated C-terminal domain-containing protein [Daejeonella sp.]|uniref:gliding motility-associated C-terminal domain-containing protein n=1 Tax=Daejeonella sp. TaxID=2805397 RepID=UPI0030BB3127